MRYKEKEYTINITVENAKLYERIKQVVSSNSDTDLSSLDFQEFVPFEKDPSLSKVQSPAYPNLTYL
jgi:hypothetical protein